MRKNTRQLASLRRGTSNPPKIPLMPRTRPLSSMNAAEARPRRMPPAKADHGVKFTQSMVIIYLLVDTCSEHDDELRLSSRTIERQW
jgi:hypothetical protein